jgi:CheY-like chemotaxis protein
MTDVLSKYELSDEIRDLIKVMRKSTEVLLGLADNVLDFSKIEAGKMTLEEVPFNLQDEIKYNIEFARAYTSSDKINILFKTDHDVPVRIIGDPLRLRHILSNLLIHSVRNTEQGEVVLRCMAGESKDGIHTIRFEIANTGKAFTENTLSVFDDADVAGSKLTERNDQADFGIILSRQLIDMMGGKLSASSPSGLPGGKGTKIMFTINVYSNERIKKTLPAGGITFSGKLNTLVITGNVRDEESLSVIHQLGLRVTVTTFMKTTIPQIKANMKHPEDRYGLIILLDDGTFNGFEAATALWQNKLSAEFVIMMISSNDKKGNYLKCISTGVDHYFVKPAALKDLQETLKNSFPSRERAPEVQVSKIPAENLKILVVEDNRLNQKVIGTILGKMGLAFDIAEDGYSAYLQAKSRQYDLILMDLLLPEMDGFEASQRILKTDRKVKIVALTADIMPETRKKSELAGIVDFISKPVTTEDLRRVFEKHFGK